jgi:lysophospholipase L1-like esterase
MKYFYIYVILLLCFIVGVSYLNTYLTSQKEPFNTNSNSKVNENNNINKPNIILLGDSILKNNAYVSNGKSIDDLITERNNGNIYCYAVDHSKVVDVYSQLDQIPLDLNLKSTTVFLSVGGNDILTYYEDQEGDSTNTSILNKIFAAYKSLIRSIQTKLSNVNIVLLDIYYPDNLKYRQYHHIIKEWNQMIYTFAANTNNNIEGVLKISSLLTKQEDFSFGIEPSSIGGEKIVENILNYY